MAWKKALFLGGAVLLLAACSDATAPKPLTRNGAAPASSFVVPSDSSSPSTIDPSSLIDTDCRSGYYVRSGDKDLCIDVPELP